MRHFIDIIMEAETSFDQRNFFRRLKTLSADITDLNRRGKKNTTDYSDAVASVFASIRNGKQQLRDSGVGAAEYNAFVDQINKLLINSGLGVRDTDTQPKSSVSSAGPSMTVKAGAPQNYNVGEIKPAAQAQPASKWQVLNLAVKRDEAGSPTVGVAKQSQDFYYFKNVMNGKPKVYQTDYKTATGWFYKAIKAEGYKEISPGAYRNVQTLNDLGRHNPYDLPKTANVWR
jgi:hypothetical protein